MTTITDLNSKPLAKSPAHILKDVYLARREKNLSYSLQSFARDLGISKSFLSRIFSGERQVSLNLAVQLSTALHLNDSQTKALLLAVIQAQPKETKIAKKMKAQLEQQLSQETEATDEDNIVFTTVEIERFKAMASWHHLAILNLVTVKGFKTDHNLMAKQLGITVIEVREAIERLTALGLLHEREGELKRSTNSLYVKTQKSVFAVRNFHEQMINKAKEELKDTTPKAFNNRLINGITFVCGKDQIELIKEKIDKFQDEILTLTGAGEPEELYQMNVQFFPLTKSNTGEEQ